MAAVLESTRSFLYKRRKPLVVLGSIAGGCYLAGKYALDRLRQVQVRMVEERRDKENLRRRFAQNQEDCTFTVLALLPTLGDQLFEKMNVEELTSMLQKSRVSTAPAAIPAPAPAPVAEAPAPAVDQQESVASLNGQAAETEATVAAAAPTEPAPVEESKPAAAQEPPTESKETNKGEEIKAEAEKDAAPQAGESSIAAVAEPSAETEVTKPEASAEPPAKAAALPTGASALDLISEPAPAPISPDARLTPVSNQSPRLDGEVQDKPADEPKAEEAAKETPSEPAPAAVPAPAAEAAAEAPRQPTEEEIIEEKRAKLALWNELKVVAFSRTLTSIYAIVLLTLQTHIQLNLIGRYAYLASVSTLAKPAPANHRIDVNAGSEFEADQDFAKEALRQRMESTDSAADAEPEAGLSHDTERVYLTYSWWFLHKGWDLVAQRVRDAVEETFGRVPLKSQLSWLEFNRLLSTTRRKVEYEILGEERPENGVRSSGVSEVSATTKGSRRLLARRLNFLDALFPTTLEEELNVLISAGAVPPHTPIAALEADVQLRHLLDETKDFIDSRDFRSVLRLCLDRAFGVFGGAMQQAFGIDTSEDARFQELSADGELGRRMRLATLFPAVAKQSQLAIHGAPNEYVESLSDVKELRALSAVIYSSWAKPQ